jgi:hypothetical protein
MGNKSVRSPIPRCHIVMAMVMWHILHTYITVYSKAMHYSRFSDSTPDPLIQEIKIEYANAARKELTILLPKEAGPIDTTWGNPSICQVLCAF